MQPLFTIPEEASPKASFVWRNGKRYFTQNSRESAGHAVTAEVDLLNWTSPAGSTMTIGVVIPCPACKFPLLMKADDNVLSVDDDNRLSYRGVIECPAHWSDVNEYGQVNMDGRSGRPMRRRCGWTAVIMDGQAHHPKCGGLRDRECRCGAEIEHSEAIQIARGRA
jgi:hypothetical protein